MKRSFKRPFQPSISSYLGRSPRETENNHSSRTSILSPTLPATIQSNLLNVGMRVRKSVPEGYKTRPKTFCAPATNAWDTAPNDTDPASQHSRNASTAHTGLVPYCDILRVGGHITDSVPAEEDIPPLQFDHEDWGSFATSSQESASTMTTTTSGHTVAPLPTLTGSIVHKRRREDADEEDLDVEAQPVSPRSRPVSHTRMPNLDQLRAIAVPKSRRKPVCNDGSRESEMIDAGDFGEADFFRPDEWGGDYNWRELS